jgi:hypothetical protein
LAPNSQGGVNYVFKGAPSGYDAQNEVAAPATCKVNGVLDAGEACDDQLNSCCVACTFLADGATCTNGVNNGCQTNICQNQKCVKTLAPALTLFNPNNASVQKVVGYRCRPKQTKVVLQFAKRTPSFKFANPVSKNKNVLPFGLCRPSFCNGKGQCTMRLFNAPKANGGGKITQGALTKPERPTV